MLEDETEKAKQLVRTDAYQMSVSEIVNMYRDEELIINPNFQRLYRWEIGQKSNLIESFLLGIPIPSIFVFEKENAKWELIDGLQRTSTILEFMGYLKDPDSGELLPPIALVATKYLPSLDRVVWEKSNRIDLPVKHQVEIGSTYQLAIRRSRLSVEILKRPSSNETKFELFQRLNAGGTQANAQELRNVIIIMVNEEYFKFIKDCSLNNNFLNVLSPSEDQLEKQRDTEYVSRFLVHTFVDYNSRLDVEEFIDTNIVDLAIEGKTKEAKSSFDKTFKFLDDAFGGNALRRFKDGTPTGRVLLAAYECIAVGISRNLNNIESKGDPLEFVKERIESFWKEDEIEQFFVAGLRGTARIQRTVPYGANWFSV